jgi:hypothetical protein
MVYWVPPAQPSLVVVVPLRPMPFEDMAFRKVARDVAEVSTACADP